MWKWIEDREISRISDYPLRIISTFFSMITTETHVFVVAPVKRRECRRLGGIPDRTAASHHICRVPGTVMPSRMPNSLLPSTVTTSKSIESICIVFLHPKLTCDVHTTGTHENARNLGHLQRIQAQHGRGRFLLVIGMKMQCRAQTCLAIIQLSFLAQACVANLRSTVIL